MAITNSSTDTIITTYQPLHSRTAFSGQPAPRQLLTDMNLSSRNPTEIIINLGSPRPTRIRLGSRLSRRGGRTRAEIRIRKRVYRGSQKNRHDKREGTGDQHRQSQESCRFAFASRRGSGGLTSALKVEHAPGGGELLLGGGLSVHFVRSYVNNR